VHDLQESQVLPGIGHIAYHIGKVLDPSTWYAALLAGMFNITPEPTVLEVIAWAAYGVPALVLFLSPSRKLKAPRKPGSPSKPEASSPKPEPQPVPAADSESTPAPAPQP